MSILVNTEFATGVIADIGTPEQKEEFLAPVVRGEKIAALGVSEPDCGSDVSAISTTAKEDGDDFIINGAKTYITNASLADYITLAVRTGEEGYGGISLVLFPTDTPGFSVGRKLDKLGTRSVDSSEIHFDNCRIPKRNLLGIPNGGFIHIMQNFQGERLCGSLMAVQGMDIAVQDAIKFGNERKAFNRPIIKFQVWKHKFAEHLSAIQAARMLTYRTVDKIISGEDPTWRYHVQARCGHCSESHHDCLQFHGGSGFIEEYDIARTYRDMRLLPIADGIRGDEGDYLRPVKSPSSIVRDPWWGGAQLGGVFEDSRSGVASGVH